MADSKLSALPAVTTLSGSDLLYVDASNASSKMTSTNFNAVVRGSITDRIVFCIGDGTNVITTGIKKCVEVRKACTITGWKILSDDASTTSGAIVIDIWRLAYATSYPPLVANSLISGGTKPTITASATSAASSSMANWNTSLLAGDILRFNVDSVTSLTSITLILATTLV